MEWTSLADLAKGSGALAKAVFLERFPAPFLLQLNPMAGDVVDTETATRGFDLSATVDVDPRRARVPELTPSLDRSLIFHFGSQGSFVAGRSNDCDIPCAHRTVSKRHCRFESFESMWAVTDLGSTNGVYLNGQAIPPDSPTPLKFGTKIVLSEAQYLFLSNVGAYDLIQSLLKEPRIRPRSLRKLQAEFRRAGDQEQVLAAFPGPFVVIQAPTGRDAGSHTAVQNETVTLSPEQLKKGVSKNTADAVFDLSKHNLVRIGRASVTQIHLPLRGISTLQAALIREGEGWFIQDLGAKNGTYLWGKRLTDREAVSSGTEIMLGNIKSIFFNTEDLVTYVSHRDTLV